MLCNNSDGEQSFTGKQCEQLGYGYLGKFGIDNKLASSEEELKPGKGSLISGPTGASWVIDPASEATSIEHSKRPLCNVGPYQVACKRPKQVEQSRQSDYVEGEASFVPPLDQPPVSADECFGHGESDESPDSSPDHSGYRTSIGSLSLPVYTWNTGVEERSLDLPVRLRFFPSHFDDCGRADEFDEVDGTHPPRFKCLPRKPVPMGPNHQAEIPDWNSQDLQNDSGDRWIRTCIVPMPESHLTPTIRIGNCKFDCVCPDEGSIRCVRQHVMVARESIKRRLGPELFEMLGFYEMGEDVALRWAEEEERLFEEVALSNPQSLGKNFWYELPDAFPTKSTKELVSYYFNVFVLRKRAKQNRVLPDPMNADSDDDEWQGSNEGEEDEDDEDEDDSVVDSLMDRDNAAFGTDYMEAYLDEEYEGDEYTKTELECLPAVHLGHDPDVQDESCTSFEGQHGGAGSSVDADEKRHGVAGDPENLRGEYRNDGLSGVVDNGFFDDLSFSCGKGDEFLATSNVIEEVIGMEAWENNALDNHGSS